MDWGALLGQALPILVGMGVVFVFTQRNAANAQKIVNDEFPKLRLDFDTLQKEHTTLKDEKQANDIKVAEERGTLTERIRRLDERVSQERKLREEQGAQHTKTLTVLETQLASMKELQKELQDNLLKEIEERTRLSEQLAQKLHQIEALMGEVNSLRSQIEEKDRVIAGLRAQLAEQPATL